MGKVSYLLSIPHRETKLLRCSQIASRAPIGNAAEISLYSFPFGLLGSECGRLPTPFGTSDPTFDVMTS